MQIRQQQDADTKPEAVEALTVTATKGRVNVVLN